MNRRSWVLFVFAALAVLLVAASCGDDDSGGGDTTTSAEATETTEPTETTTGDEAAAVPAGLCELAEEMFNSEDFPTAAQLEQYQELAPPEIKDDVDTVAPLLIAEEGDPNAFFMVVADDDNEVALDNINAWEEENCGIPHSTEGDGSGNPEGTTLEIEPDATRVDVAASEYTFAFDEPIEAGRTSFVLTNNGEEAHYMGLGKLADGVELAEALESEDESMIEFLGDSNLAAPGGDDEEPLTVDLESGNYGIVCFLPGPDGTPHAFSGMAIPFTVA